MVGVIRLISLPLRVILSLNLACLCPLLDFLLRQNQHLRHGEQTDQGAGGVDALIQRGLSEHEPLSALHGVHADGGQQQAQRTGDQALQQGTWTPRPR